MSRGADDSTAPCGQPGRSLAPKAGGPACTEAAPDAVVARLGAALESGALRGRAAARAQALIDRLSAPVRIALLGVPGAGAADLAETLFALPALPRGPLPPLEVTPLAPTGTPAQVPANGTGRVDGAAPSGADGCLDAVHVVTSATGERRREAGWPGPACYASAVHLSVSAPLPRLTGRRLLLLEVPGPEFGAALRWAAGRSDLAILVSASRSGPERQAFAEAPGALRDHAILMALGPQALPMPGECFARAFDPLSDPDALDAVERHLADTIATAREADALAGLMLLRRHGPSAPSLTDAFGEQAGPASRLPSAPPDIGAPSLPHRSGARDTPGHGTDLTDTVTGPSRADHAVVAKPVRPDPLEHDCVCPTAASDPSASDARDRLCRAFLRLRGDAGRLLARLPAGPLPPDVARDVLDAVQRTLEDVAEMTAGEDGFSRSYPEIDAAVSEAIDLVTLLGLEGGPTHARDACALLAQVREETGAALAA